MRLLSLIISILAWTILVVGLALPTFAPEISNVLMLVLMGFALLHLIWLPQRGHLVAHAAVSMPLLAGLLLFGAFSLTAKSPLHAAAFLALIHLYMVAPMAGLLARLGSSLTLDRVGLVALTGTTGAFVVAIIDVFVLGSERAGLVNNPIHLAELSLALGFVALIGLWSANPLRSIFLLGPILSIVTVYLTGSRGPALAAVPMIAVAAIAVGRSWYVPRAARWLIATLIAGAGIAVFGLLMTGDAGGTSLSSRIAGLLRIGGAADANAVERLAMYQSAINAFLASPLVGYGLLDYVVAAAAHASPGKEFPLYAHLHNDIADFAVAGGIAGLAAYALFLLAPLVGAMRARGPLRVPLLYLGSVTTTGYFFMGLTNAMIGLRWQDIVLASVLALIVTLSLRSQETAEFGMTA